MPAIVQKPSSATGSGAAVRLDPAAAARDVQSINDELARHKTTPPAIASAVHELTARLLAEDVERWLEVEPYHALLAHRAALQAEEALVSGDDDAARDRLRLALGRMALALSLIDEAEPAGEQRAAKEVVRWLAAVLDVPQREVAGLLGVDLRKLQRWLSEATANQPEGDDARRVRVVAKLVNQLRHSLSGPGVVAWFGWPRPDLGGVAPAALLDDVSRTPDLLLAAGSMRSTALA